MSQSGPCWEFLKCGREGVCPAYPDYGFDCYKVTGTECRGETQGSYEEKIAKCRATCAFYNDLLSGKIKLTG